MKFSFTKIGVESKKQVIRNLHNNVDCDFVFMHNIRYLILL